MSEKFDVTMGTAGMVRIKYWLDRPGVIVWVPYGGRDFFVWLFEEVLGIKRLPKLGKGSGRFEFRAVFERRGTTGERWVRKWREQPGLFVTRVVRGGGKR